MLAAGVVLTRGTPVYDLVHERVYRATPIGAAGDSGRRGRRARRATGGVRAGARSRASSLQTPVIVKYRDEKTDLATALEAWLR